MKIFFYGLWIGSTLLIGFAVWFNHCAELHWVEAIMNMLYHEYSRQWVTLNAGITLLWFLLTCIGMMLISRKG